MSTKMKKVLLGGDTMRFLVSHRLSNSVRSHVMAAIYGKKHFLGELIMITSPMLVMTQIVRRHVAAGAFSLWASGNTRFRFNRGAIK